MTADKKDLRGSWRQALLSLTGAILLILTIRWAFFEPYVIPSGSMIPTLLIHDHILVNKLSYGLHVPFSTAWIWQFTDPKRGDVIVFRSVDDEGIFLIKRVVGLPGDEIRVTEGGQLMINSELVSRLQLSRKDVQDYLSHWTEDMKSEYIERYDVFAENFDGHIHHILRAKDSAKREQGPYHVPPGELFMMGDNRDNSADSRVWGMLPIGRVLGRATSIWLSCEETLPEANQLCDPKTLRWDRIAKAIR